MQKPDRKFSYVQVDVPEPLRSEILAFGESIPKHLLAGEGLEPDPHVTVFYGFHTNDPSDISNTLGLCRRQVVTVRLGDMTVFPNRRWDVLKIDIHGQDLYDLNSRLDELPHKSSFAYHPHLTIGYMKSGEAAEFCSNKFDGRKFFSDSVVFHSKDRKRYEVAI